MPWLVEKITAFEKRENWKHITIVEHCDTCNGKVEMFGLNRNLGNVELLISFAWEYYVYITDSVKMKNEGWFSQDFLYTVSILVGRGGNFFEWVDLGGYEWEIFWVGRAG